MLAPVLGSLTIAWTATWQPYTAHQPHISMDLQRITSEDEFEAIAPLPDSAMVQVLMVSRQGCKYASKMERAFSETCERSPLLEGLLWELGPDGDATAEALGAARTPLFVAFRNGERTFDFVAQTPGALVYGLQELGDLVGRYESGGG